MKCINILGISHAHLLLAEAKDAPLIMVRNIAYKLLGIGICKHKRMVDTQQRGGMIACQLKATGLFV